MAGAVLDGKRVNAEIQSELKPRIERLTAEARPPALAVVLVGNDPASQIYVGNKIKTCHELGIRSLDYTLPETTTTDELLRLIKQLNGDEGVDGILVQSPLPMHIDSEQVLLAIDPSKDSDGFHPFNVGSLVANRSAPRACTPAGIIELLKRYRIPISGRRAVIVGRSDIVGKPMALMLLHQDATVTICHSRTKDLAAECRRADILVAAVGKPGVITAHHIQPGAVVIDVGMNRITDRAAAERLIGHDPARMAAFERSGRTLVGDVEPYAMQEFASAYTPVPGGVGPLTIALLMTNTVTLPGTAPTRLCSGVIRVAMIRVGLTGGYATGKSFVAKELERLGCKVLYADRLGHEVLEPAGEGYAPVLAKFGEAVVSGGKIDRKKLGAIVFGNEQLLKELTAIVHPAVYRLENDLILQWQEQDPDGIAVVEAAILIETGRYRSFDSIILTHCDESIQIERGISRDGLTRNEILARLRRQLPFDEKKNYADFLIDTGGTEAATLAQVQEAFAELKLLSGEPSRRNDQ